jgi:hypothetical protein
MSAPRPPFVYTIDPEARLVSVQFAGNITYSNIHSYAASLRTDPLFSPAFSEIVDLRHVDSVILSARQAMALAYCADPFSTRAKRAFVVQNQSQINAAHLHRILRSESSKIRVFFFLDEAREWIVVSRAAAAVSG